MKLIQIADNCYKGEELSKFKIKENDSEMSDLRFISDSTIQELSSVENKHNQNLLIFPHCLKECKDLDKSGKIFEIKHDKIITNNHLGFIGRGNVQVNITSRFDKADTNYFMHYMLQKVFAINLFDLPTSSNNDSMYDFLLYLFPYYLKKALRQGLYKKYQRIEYNDAKLRGVVDVSRHIRYNIPFNGKIAYSTKEYCYDNNLTQLIRHTIEYIRNHKFGGNKLLQSDTDMKNAVSQILAATPSYNKNNRQKIILNNLKLERHPFYTEYTFLQKLCLRILRREQINYNSETNKSEVYGIVFDGAWLWEEYLATILNNCNYVHSENKTGKNPIYLFDKKYPRYPDFYKKDKSVVLDAKYKRMRNLDGKNEIDRNDMHQIVTYMYITKASKGGFIYPYNCKSDLINHSELGTLNGYAGNVFTYGLKIPQMNEVNKFIEFKDSMLNEENEVINCLNKK